MLEQARHPRLEAIPILSRAASSAGSKQVWQATSRRLRPISGCADVTRESAVGKIDLWHEEQANHIDRPMPSPLYLVQVVLPHGDVQLVGRSLVTGVHKQILVYFVGRPVPYRTSLCHLVLSCRGWGECFARAICPLNGICTASGEPIQALRCAVFERTLRSSMMWGSRRQTKSHLYVPLPNTA